MCGIAGICHIGGPVGISLDTVKSMVGVLHDRRPDEAGIYLEDRVGLGHARLSVIDLSSGTQPIHNEDEILRIVHSEELSNF